MEKVEKLKAEGNQLFSKGNVEDSIRVYKQALNLLDSTFVLENETNGDGEAREDANHSDSSYPSVAELKSVVLCNLAYAHLHLRQYQESSVAAQQAMTLNTSALKPILRFIEARMQGGYAFEAFMCLLQRARPLARVEKDRGRLSQAQVDKLLDPVEAKLQGLLGLSQLSSDIELVPYGEGVGMISRRSFAPGEVLFVEQKYLKQLAGDPALMRSTSRTEDIVLYFGKHLWPEQASNTPNWQTLLRDFHGAWPRSFDQIEPETQTRLSAHLRTHLPEVAAEHLNELLLISLRCRYNCFHHGFFRTCALANHSCRPNIAMKYDVGKETVTMVAVRAIPPGKWMNVKYLEDAHFLLGVARRRGLLRSWLFWCECDRCADDRDPATATHEFVACAACGQYTHYPYCVSSLGEDRDPGAEGTCVCSACNAIVTWSASSQETLRRLIEHPNPGCNAKELAAWLSAKLKAVQVLQVSPTSWVYRIIFYMFCLAFHQLIRACAQALETLRFSAVHASTMALIFDVFTPCGLREFYLPLLEKVKTQPVFRAWAKTSAGETRGQGQLTGSGEGGGLFEETEPGRGCDALRSLSIFCELIAGFYPSREMWAVHHTLCNCVMFQLMFQNSLVGCDTFSELSHEHALLLFQRHVAFLEMRDRIHLLNLFQSLKSRSGANTTLPSLSALKKALKLK